MKALFLYSQLLFIMIQIKRELGITDSKIIKRHEKMNHYIEILCFNFFLKHN